MKSDEKFDFETSTAGRKTMKRVLLSIALAAAFAAAPAASYAQDSAKKDSAESSALTPKQMESRAKRMTLNAVELIAQREEDRAVGMLEAVPRMFPAAKARFGAWLALGRHLANKRKNDEALAALRKVAESDVPDEKAEALLLQARVLGHSGKSGEAMMLLRRITQDYPDSEFTNDAYFEIGQTHFTAGRWMRASEAFKMVGTAVPGQTTSSNSNEKVFAEAGQKLFVHLSDNDLPILALMEGKQKAVVTSKSGDSETVEFESFGRDGTEAVISVQTVVEPSAPNDGMLTVQGGEEVTVVYKDKTTSSGDREKPVSASAVVVSTGVIAFMDGAYRQSVGALFAGQPAFIRLRDVDLDTTGDPDTIEVQVVTRRKRIAPTDEEIALGAAPLDPEADPWEEKVRTTTMLKETAGRSGVFEGGFIPVLESGTNDAPAAGTIMVMAEDQVSVEYEDRRHLGSAVPEMRIADAVVLVGSTSEPQSIVANSSDPGVQARKLLLEAMLLHKWASIFKDVGLDSHAKAKSDEGLEKISDVMVLAVRNGLERELIEQSYAAKWDLFLVQDRLSDAIRTCNELVRKYPDTSLADMAFMKIASAKMESNEPADINEAIRIYRSVIALPVSTAKAEAQFCIASGLEKIAKLGTKPNYAAAIAAFRTCAETYPDSSYAGESFKRIVNYYIGIKDYPRAMEMLARIFQDYPDAPWLDEMLVRWGVALYRTGDHEGAREKFLRVLEEYPGGAAAQQAASFIARLQ